MKFFKIFPVVGMLISCAASNSIEISKYETAFNAITQKYRNSQPYKDEFGSDACGTKIIPKIYKFEGKYKDFDIRTSKRSKDLERLSEKYARKDWRKDEKYRILKADEIKNFHGPLDYLYFSEIKNDSLKVQILGNPFLKYEMTTGNNYLIIFEKGKVKTIENWKNHYD